MLRALKNAFRLRPLPDKTQPTTTSLPGSQPDDILRQGHAAIARKDYRQAAEQYAQYIAYQPNAVSGYIGLGFALSELGRWSEAVEPLRQAVALDGSNADGFFMLGRAFLQQGQFAAAEQAWTRAHELAPGLQHLYLDHCLLLFRHGKIDQALSLMKTGVARFPNNASFHFYLANLQAECGDFPTAVRNYRSAIALGESSPDLFSSLATALLQTGAREEAIDSLKKAAALAPDSASVASNYLLAIQYSSRFTQVEKFAAAQAFAERFEQPFRSQWGHYHPPGAEGRKLRVGYVSGDFRTHSLAFFFEPIVARHDKSRFEVFCYYSHPVVDRVTQRIQAHADHWLACHGMSDDLLAARIRADQIDVLVDLSGHTGHNRLLTFARKPAPVQMTWLGYMATTGLQAIDYRITEEALDPVGTSESFHSETLLRLPSCGTFSPSPDSPPINALPALGNQPFTFGCLNSPAKITNEAIGLWSRILNGLPQTRLMLGNATPALIERLSAEFERHGIASGRLMFQPKVGLVDYLALHHRIDLALDTFPYNGGTTTFHSLWMGVPVVALKGDSSLSQVGVSVMRGMGLEKFCAETPEQYVDRAVYFARHLEELNAARQSLRATMGQITQLLATHVTRSLESAMQSCWQNYCRNAHLPAT